MATPAMPLPHTALVPADKPQEIVKTGPLFLEGNTPTRLFLRIGQDGTTPEFSKDAVEWYTPAFGRISIVWTCPSGPNESALFITFFLLPDSNGNTPSLGYSENSPRMWLSPVDDAQKTQLGCVPRTTASTIFHFNVNDIDPGIMVTPGASIGNGPAPLESR